MTPTNALIKQAANNISVSAGWVMVSPSGPELIKYRAVKPENVVTNPSPNTSSVSHKPVCISLMKNCFITRGVLLADNVPDTIRRQTVRLNIEDNYFRQEYA